MTSGHAIVTGASGFIGTRLVDRLVKSGRHTRVRAIDIVPPRVRLPDVDYINHDVRQPLPDDLGAGAAIIYNLAAVHRTPGHPAEEYFETNIEGAINITELAARCDIPAVVFTSSISVYGPSEQVLTEESPLNPVSPYGRSKRIAEILHRQWANKADGRRLVMVRPGVVFGPGERGNYTALARALRGGYFFYPGRRDTVKSGGYVDELLATMDFALAREAREVLYNFAYPAESTTADIVRAFSDVAGFRDMRPTAPAGALLLAAAPFEVLNAVGVKNAIHRDRVRKLMYSTRVKPGWLLANRYEFGTDLASALRAWRDETDGAFE